MASKRTLKQNIRQVCSQLFAECVASSLYATQRNEEETEAMFHAIVRLERHYIDRISHPQPGMTQKEYFRDLTDKFKKEAAAIVDQINFTD